MTHAACKQIAPSRLEAQQRQAQQKAQQEEAKKTFAVNLIMSGASPEENARVRQLVASNFPEDIHNADRYWLLLNRLRAEVGRI